MSSIFSKPKNALEILEFRKALEIECLKLGIKKAEASDVEALESIFGEYWNALCAEDYKKTVSYDYRFHHQVFLMSKNSLFIEIYESMSELFFLHRENEQHYREAYGIPRWRGQDHQGRSWKPSGIGISELPWKLHENDRRACCRLRAKISVDQVSP